MQFCQWVSFLSKLEPLELPRATMLFKLRLAEPVLWSIEVWLSIYTNWLLDVFVNVHDRETKIVPYFGITLKLVGGLLKVSECLLIFLVLEQGESEVVKNLCWFLGVEVSYVFVRWISWCSWLFSLLIGLTYSEGLLTAFPYHLELVGSTVGALNLYCDILRNF